MQFYLFSFGFVFGSKRIHISVEMESQQSSTQSIHLWTTVTFPNRMQNKAPTQCWEEYSIWFCFVRFGCLFSLEIFSPVVCLFNIFSLWLLFFFSNSLKDIRIVYSPIQQLCRQSVMYQLIYIPNRTFQHCFFSSAPFRWQWLLYHPIQYKNLCHDFIVSPLQFK